jgi:hypothetical protein
MRDWECGGNRKRITRLASVGLKSTSLGIGWLSHEVRSTHSFITESEKRNTNMTLVTPNRAIMW